MFFRPNPDFDIRASVNIGSQIPNQIAPLSKNAKDSCANNTLLYKAM